MLSEGFLSCSCKTYERYGYPCHHLFHVLECNKTSDIQKEWIHIRWTKDYVLNYLHPDTNDIRNHMYDKLYSNQPIGIKHVVSNTLQYPIYNGFDGISINTTMFNVPDSQFMSQNNRMLWIEQNKTNCPELNALLQTEEVPMINNTIVLSQSQQQHIDNDKQINENNDFIVDDNEDDDLEPSNNDIMSFTENNGLFKRAFDLAGNDVDKHRKLYNMLSDFVIENEISHNDNAIVLKKRSNDDVINISSNKIVNTSHRSNKRTKNGWEM